VSEAALRRFRVRSVRREVFEGEVWAANAGDASVKFNDAIRAGDVTPAHGPSIDDTSASLTGEPEADGDLGLGL
jgi:hypothetical protein